MKYVIACLFVAVAATNLYVDPVHDRNTDLRRQLERAADHAVVVLPMTEGPSLVSVIGEAGVGKSTLVKVLSGVHQPDAVVVDDRLAHGPPHRHLHDCSDMKILARTLASVLCRSS